MLVSSSVPVGGIEPRQISTYANEFIVLLSLIKEKQSGCVPFPVTEIIRYQRTVFSMPSSNCSSAFGPPSAEEFCLPSLRPDVINIL